MATLAVLSIPIVYLLAAASLMAGANNASAAFMLTGAHALLLLAWLGFSPKARDTLAHARVAIAPAVMFATTLGAGLWSLSAWTPGGALPVWQWTGQSGAATLDRSATITELVKLGGLACIFAVGFIQGGRPLVSRATLKILLVLGAIYGFAALLIFLSDGQHSWQLRRLKGGFLSANTTGTLFGVLTVLSLSWVIQGLRGLERDRAPNNVVEQLAAVAPRAAVLVLLTGCLLLSASRAAISITAVAMAVCLAWEMAAGGLKGRPGAVMGLSGAAYLGVLLAGAGAVALSRFDKLAIDFAERGAMFAVHWKMFAVSPLFGWGLGTFDQINQQVMTPASDSYLWRLRATHNVVLQWLEEAGIVGALPMFACLALVIGFTFAGLRRRRESASWIRALLVADAVILTHGMSDFALQVPVIASLWALLLGLQLSMAHPLPRRDSVH